MGKLTGKRCAGEREPMAIGRQEPEITDWQAKALIQLGRSGRQEPRIALVRRDGVIIAELRDPRDWRDDGILRHRACDLLEITRSGKMRRRGAGLHPSAAAAGLPCV